MSETQEEDAIMHDGSDLLENVEQELAMQEDEPTVEKTKVKRSKPAETERLPGTTVLPAARVQRIIKADKEVQMVNKEAAFLVSLATEHFIKRLTDQSYVQARLDQRKTVALKDLTSVIKSSEEFSFLEDIVPATVPLSAALAMRAKNAVRDAELAEANQSQPLADTLPKAPHSVSTDPKYPDALIKRPPNTHGKKPKAVSATVKEKITGGKASAPASVASSSLRQSSRPRKPKQNPGDEPVEAEESPVEP